MEVSKKLMESSEGTNPSTKPTSLPPLVPISPTLPPLVPISPTLPPLVPCSPTLVVQGHQSVPLPVLDWADSSKMWEEMRSKDSSKAFPELELRLKHPCILPSLRSRLVSWIMQACFRLHLHRETFYLFLDIFDRYMDTQHDVQPKQIRLIGTTSLWIASKLEEVYVPNLERFVFVSKGECPADKMIKEEAAICTALGWRMCPNITAHTWATMYLHIGTHKLRPTVLENIPFEYPALPNPTILQVMKVLDLSSMDIRSRKFGSSVLAASAFYLTTGMSERLLKLVTGYAVGNIWKCLVWLEPFLAVIRREGEPAIRKELKGVAPDDVLNIQGIDVSMTMFEEATKLRQLQDGGMLLSFVTSSNHS